MSSRSQLAIHVSGLTKEYKIYDKPVDRLKEVFSPLRKIYSTRFKALKNVNFSVPKGEFLGIIGRNGAGKSTLLKILSGEVVPTEGEVKINGSVSLLQLGVGFNKELNGLENINFSAKLLGYSDQQIKGMIEEIIQFADIGEFIKHPVKLYSSGMYSRLSFAVGITINPDILIADEVLSVGDMRFATKCLRKMHEIKEKGKTVILVTHDISKVTVFCDRAMWLKDGKIVDIGHPKSVTEKYRDYMLYGQSAKPKKITKEARNNKGHFRQNRENPNTDIIKHDFEWINIEHFSCIQKEDIKITHAAIYNKQTMKPTYQFERGERMLICLKLRSNIEIDECSVGWMLTDKNALIALHSNSKFCGKTIENITRGDQILCIFNIKIPPLRNSEYIFSFGIKNGDRLVFKINDVIPIQILSNESKSKQGGYIIVENEEFLFAKIRLKRR